MAKGTKYLGRFVESQVPITAQAQNAEVDRTLCFQKGLYPFAFIFWGSRICPETDIPSIGNLQRLDQMFPYIMFTRGRMLLGQSHPLIQFYQLESLETTGCFRMGLRQEPIGSQRGASCGCTKFQARVEGKVPQYQLCGIFAHFIICLKKPNAHKAHAFSPS